jgi:hypothetical protein
MINLYKLQNIYNQLIYLLSQFKNIYVKKLNELPDCINRIVIGENRMSLYVDTTIQNITENDLRGATSIKNYAFRNTNCISIIIPDSVTSLGDYMCVGNSTLESIIIGNSVTYIPRAFENCVNLQNIVFGNNIKKISNDAFRGCARLKNITFPDSIVEIGGNAFYRCNALTDIYLNSTTPPSLDNAAAIPDTTTIHVPVGSGDAYRNATNWSYHATRIIEDPEL